MGNKKRKIIDIILVSLAVLAFLIFAKTVLDYFINKSFVDNFKDGTYNKAFEDILSSTTLFERYVPLYNRGNQYYQEGDYEKAVIYYEAALQYNVPEGKECDIRVNYALALMKMLDPVNYADEEHINETWSIILTAEKVLTEEECAKFRPDTGHDETAQKLLDEIEKIKETLPPPDTNQTSNETQNSSGGGDDQNESNDTNEQNSSSNGNSTSNNTKEEEEDPYNGLENQIRGLQQNTIDQREKSMQEDEYYYGNGITSKRYDRKNW